MNQNLLSELNFIVEFAKSRTRIELNQNLTSTACDQQTLVHCASGVTESAAGNWHVSGGRNYIFSEDGCVFGGVIRFSGSGNAIFLGRNVSMKNATIHLLGSGCIAVLDDDVQMMPTSLIRVIGDGGLVEVGRGTVLAERCIIANSDGHGIYDQETGRRRNIERDVIIGRDVYVGAGSRINKGSSIGDGSIIEEGSVVNGQLSSFTLYSGVPAQAIEHDIVWSLDLVDNIYGSLPAGIEKAVI